MQRTLDRFGDQSGARRMSFAGHDPLSYPCSEGEWQQDKKQWSAVQEWQQAKSWWGEQKDRRNRAQEGWTVLDYAAVLLPCIKWIRAYNIKQWLLYDVLAGIAVGFTVVPQAMSYANIAGVPAVMGLYGAFMPILVYSLFGSSKQLGVGPVAVTSGLIFSGLAGVVPGYEGIMDPNDPKPDQVAVQAEYNRNVIQLAFIVAVLYTAVGLLRLGFLIRFLSHPVIAGFTSGAALVIAAGQLKYIFGVSYKKQDTLQGELSNLFSQLAAGKFRWQEFVMGASIILFLVSLKYVQRKWPKTLFLKALGPFIACVVGIIVVVAAGLSNGKGPIKIVKNIPQGLPPVSVQQWAPVDNLSHLLPLAFIVMAVDMLESTSIARALARKNGYRLAYNQEIVALGIANFAGALFSSYTTTGSFSRSAINNSCGAKTQLSGFVTSIIVMCVLLFLTPVFRLMPYNTMGAIIIVGVSQLVEIGVGIELFKVHLRDFLVWLTAFLVTTFAGVEIGLMSSIALSLVIIVAESSFPHTAILGRIAKTNVYRSVRRYKDAQTVPGVVIIRLDAPLHFGNVLHLEQLVQQSVEDGDRDARRGGATGVKYLVVDLSPVVRSDSSGAHMLYDLAKDCNDKGIQLVLCNPSCKLITMLGRINMHEVLPHKWIFVHTHDGVQAAIKAMNAFDCGEGGFSIPAGHMGTSTTNHKDVNPGAPTVVRNLSHVSEGFELGSASFTSGSGDGSGDLSVAVHVAGGFDSSAHRHYT